MTVPVTPASGVTVIVRFPPEPAETTTFESLTSDWFEDVAVTVTAAAPDSVSFTTKFADAGTFFPTVWFVGDEVSVGAVFGSARVVNETLPGVACAFQRASFATK